jgi:hypothetical protein
MPSWSMPGWDWEDDSPADRYQRGLELAVLEERALGWQPPDGWRRPHDPVCPEHGYGVVDGLCGVCVLKIEAQRRAA